jgi:DNA ligase-1
MMTATLWEDGDPKDWWMTEKFDGMRLYWNGTEFVTRHGKKLKVPEFISGNMPKMSLDGELWTQYGLYQEAVSLAKAGDEEKWKKAVFWVFDAPEIDKQFEVIFLKENLLIFCRREFNF